MHAFPQKSRFRMAGPALRRWIKGAAGAAGVLLLLALGFLCFIGVIGGNFRTVTPGRVYRSGQLSPGHLERVLREHRIRTVISLRGGNKDDKWFRREAATCARQGVTLRSVSLRATDLTRPEQLRKLLTHFDRSEYPILFHCRGGSDRAGLATTLYLHLYEGVPLDQAQARGLTWRYGHFHWRAPGVDRFLDLYRADGRGADLRRWVEQSYPKVYAALKPPGRRKVEVSPRPVRATGPLRTAGASR